MWLRKVFTLCKPFNLLEIESLTSIKSLVHTRGADKRALPPHNHHSRHKDERSQKKTESFLRIVNINDGRAGGLRRYRFQPRVDDDDDKKKFMFKGKSDEYNDVDLESLDKLEQDLDLYARGEHLYHEKHIRDDIQMRRRVKMAILKKKIAKIEGQETFNFNLLTWDAKEQIKHLNLNEPGFYRQKIRG
jgi:hypothetical protein